MLKIELWLSVLLGEFSPLSAKISSVHWFWTSWVGFWLWMLIYGTTLRQLLMSKLWLLLFWGLAAILFICGSFRLSLMPSLNSSFSPTELWRVLFLIRLKNFCAWDLTWAHIRVPTNAWISFQRLPYSWRPWRNLWCSSSVHFHLPFCYSLVISWLDWLWLSILCICCTLRGKWAIAPP